MDASQQKKLPWLTPRFSMRLLLAAFTAFAIAFPIWYRWPYQEVELLGGPGKMQITTWQRQWGGGRLRHGPARVVLDGRTLVSESYRNGVQHGPFAYDDTSVQLSGKFENGQKEGIWTTIVNGKSVVKRTFREGKEESRSKP